MHIVVGELNAYQTMIEDCNQLASKNLLNSSATKTARRIIMIMHLKGWYLKKRVALDKGWGGGSIGKNIKGKKRWG